MNSKKILFVTLGILFFVICIMVIVEKTAKNKIKYYDAKIVLEEDGSIGVEETLVIDYKNYVNYLYRDIISSKNFDMNPLIDSKYYEMDKAHLDEESVNVTVYSNDIINDFDNSIDITDEVNIGYSYKGDKDANGEDIKCPCVEDYCPANCNSIYLNRRFEGLYSFRFKYEIKDMATLYNDCGELYYKMFEYLGAKAEVAAVTIVIPESSYTIDDLILYSNTDLDKKIEKVSNREVALVCENVKEDDLFEFRFIFPTDILSEYDENLVIEEDMLDRIVDYENGKIKMLEIENKITKYVSFATIMFSLFLVICTVIIYVKYDKEFVPVFKETKLSNPPSDIPPAILSYLYYNQVISNEAFTSTIFNLIRKNVISFEEINDEKDYLLTLNEYSIELMSHELAGINLLFSVIGDGKTVRLKSMIEYSKKTSTASLLEAASTDFKNKVIEDGKKYNYYIENRKDKARLYYIGYIGVLFSIITFILSAFISDRIMIYLFISVIITVIYFIYVSNIRKRSISGNEEYAKWKAYKNYLTEISGIKNFDFSDIEYYDMIVIYGVCFKLTEQAIQNLTVNIDNGGVYYMFINHFNDTYNNASRTAHQSVSSHSSGSSGGGGGGFRSGR